MNDQSPHSGIFHKVGTGPGSHGRWPCATGLASYPSSCVWIVCNRATAVLRRLPFFGFYCRCVVAAVVSAVSVRSGSIRGGIDSFSCFRLRCRKPFDGVIPSSGTVGIVPPHWLAVTTSGVSHRLRSPAPSETRMDWGVTWLAIGFVRPRHFFLRAAPARRLAPRFRIAEECELLRGNG